MISKQAEYFKKNHCLLGPHGAKFGSDFEDSLKVGLMMGKKVKINGK